MTYTRKKSIIFMVLKQFFMHKANFLPTLIIIFLFIMSYIIYCIIIYFIYYKLSFVCCILILWFLYQVPIRGVEYS